MLLDAILEDRSLALAEFGITIEEDDDGEIRSTRERIAKTLIVIGTIADLLSIGTFIADRAQPQPTQPIQITIIGDDNTPRIVVLDAAASKNDISRTVTEAVREATQ